MNPLFIHRLYDFQTPFIWAPLLLGKAHKIYNIQLLSGHQLTEPWKNKNDYPTRVFSLNGVQSIRVIKLYHDMTALLEYL